MLAAFWGLETDYGAIQGDFDTLNALVTLSYDCRRPDLFRPQLIALLAIRSGRRRCSDNRRMGWRNRHDAASAEGLS
ncbi:hypothetical protein HED50_04375 [Ochrobactrum oryzae]|nr:hypothetical protein [Brucella oryzae]